MLSCLFCCLFFLRRRTSATRLKRGGQGRHWLTFLPLRSWSSHRRPGRDERTCSGSSMFAHGQDGLKRFGSECFVMPATMPTSGGDNLRHGKGMMIAADGSRKIGAWNYDSFVEPRVVQTPPATNPARPDSPATPAATQRREPPRSPKGDPTPQEVFGAFFDIINKFEKR